MKLTAIKASNITNYKYQTETLDKTSSYIQKPNNKKEEINFKSLAVIDFVKGVSKNFPPKEIVNKNIGKGILFKKLIKFSPDSLKGYELNTLIKSLRKITPESIEALAKFLGLRTKSLSWEKTPEEYMQFFCKYTGNNFENDKYKFDNELFNFFYNEISPIANDPENKHSFNVDKYISFLPYCKDNNGFHPEILKFGKFDYYENQKDIFNFFIYDKDFYKNGKYNIDLIKYCYNIIDLDYNFSTKNIIDILCIYFDKNKNIDTDAANFYKEMYEEERGEYTNQLRNFIILLKNSEGRFQNEYKDYFQKFLTSHFDILPKLLNYRTKNPKIDLKTILDRGVDIIDYRKLSPTLFLSEITNHTDTLLKNDRFEEFKKILESYGEHLPIEYIVEILQYSTDKKDDLSPKVLKFAEYVFTTLTQKENEPVSNEIEQSELLKLFKKIVSKDGKINLTLLNTIQERHKKPYPAYIINTIIDCFEHSINNKKLDETLELYTQFMKDFDKEISNTNNDDRISKFATIFTEYNYIYKNNPELVKKFIPVFGIENCHSLLKKYFHRPEELEILADITLTMRNNKQLLRNHDEDLNDEKIFNTILAHNNDFLNFFKLIGKPVFLEALNLKLNKLVTFITSTVNYRIEFYENKLCEKINPKESEQYKKLDAKLKDTKAKLQRLLTLEHKNIISLNKAKIDQLEKDLTSENRKQTIREIKTLQSEIQSIYKHPKYSTTIKRINTLSLQKKHMLSSAIKDPKEALKLINNVFKLKCTLNEEEIDKYIELATKNDKNSKEELSDFINSLVFKYNEIPYGKELAKKLDFSKSEYLIGILNSDSGGFKHNFKNLCKIIKEAPLYENIKETLDNLPYNQQTRKNFRKNDINYDKWVDFDPNSYIEISTDTNLNNSKESIIKNIQSDLTEDSWLYIPKKEIDKINNALKENRINYKIPNEINKELLNFEELTKIISIIENIFNKEDFWNTQNYNSVIEKSRSILVTNLLKMRVTEIRNLYRTSGSQDGIKVRKTDMNNIPHALFLGNHASCCTQIGSGAHQWSAPLYVINKCISSIEVVDGNDFVGNTMIYLAKVDGKVSLILDNIELKAKYQYNNKIQDAIFKYAEKLCAELGQPDMPIYAGQYRHKIDIENFPQKRYKVKLLGESNKEIYIDSITIQKFKDEKQEVNLYKIK